MSRMRANFGSVVWIISSLVVGIFFLVPSVSVQERVVPGMHMPIPPVNTEQKSPVDESHALLIIRLNPGGKEELGKLNNPGEILLIDAQGRRTGEDPRTKKRYKEIPISRYEGLSLLDTPELELNAWEIGVSRPTSGKYTLLVIGTATTQYSVTIDASDCDGNDSDAMFLNVWIKKGAVHTYIIKYSDKPGAKVKTRRVRK